MDGQQHSQASEAVSGVYTEEGERSPHPVGQAREGSFPIFFGKHRMQAAISHLNNQVNIIQEELKVKQLETIGESSTVCKDVISSVESTADPLLPLTKVSVDVVWDRWFRGAHNSRSHKSWI